MKRQITLDRTDCEMLEGVLDYLVCDDKEHDDFIENHEGAEEWFNEHEILELDRVPEDAKGHIYYKTEFLRQQLIEELNDAY